MQTKLTFVRHGQTDWNARGIIQGRSDVPLNTTGMNQAKNKAPFFKNNIPDLAISSPLQRAKQTLTTLLDENAFPLSIITDNRLIERSFGYAEGRHVDFMHTIRKYKQFPTDYENNEQLEARVAHFMNDKVSKYPNKNILIVAHSHVLKAALIYVDQNVYSYKTPLDNLAVCDLVFDHNIKKWQVHFLD